MEQSFALKRTKDVLWVIAMAGLVAMIGRTIFGLGAASNLTDGVPWGLWKVLNMVAGVCLATGGFILACVIYIFNLQRYKALARPAILIAFLGYGASGFALTFDIGLPWRVWHPMVPTFWNPHSFLFEVTMCVMTYFFVSFLEFLPIVFERFPWNKITHFLHQIALPFIVLGITLSTMHHSSLGSLFMVSPTRLHPIWFSQWIPIEFLSSSIGSGIASIIFISIVYAALYRKKLDMPMLSNLALASMCFILFYAILRMVDFTVHDKWKYLTTERTWEAYVVMVEFALEVIIPVIVFALPALRKNPTTLALGTLSAVLGVIMYRLDCGIVGYFRDAGAAYIPSLAEISFSLGVFAAAGLVFFFVVEHYYVFNPPETCAERYEIEGHDVQAPKWTFAELIAVFDNPNAVRIGAIIVAAIPLSVFAFSGTAVRPFQWFEKAVSPAAGHDVERKVLKIDGDNDGNFVIFAHEKHNIDERKINSKNQNYCTECHHLSLPNDNATPCSRCHRDMNIDTDIFNMQFHADKLGGKTSCNECHLPGKSKGPESIKPDKTCFGCHEKNMKGITPDTGHIADSYYKAMHGKCLTCHRLVGEECKPKADCASNCLSCHLPAGQEFKIKSSAPEMPR